MTAAVGDLVTVLPHQVAAGWTCGRWNGRVRSLCLASATEVWVQEVKPAGNAWDKGMTLQVRVDHLVPIELDVDLFGNPAGGVR